MYNHGGCIMNLETYKLQNKKTLDERIKWWRNAKFGMFIHYGIYSCYGRGEWIKKREGISQEEYMNTLNSSFNYQSGAAEEWIKCAKNAGMKYAVLTTQHHDGFSLWNSAVNPYNSVNYGPKTDIVKDFVDACRKYDLKVGLYFSLANWEHPDGTVCIKDENARRRFIAHINEQVRELMTQYDEINILWYDGHGTLPSAEAWGSLERNQMVRELQPNILINDRSLLDEDYGTPEDSLNYNEFEGDWEACMRFSETAFGGVDHIKARPFKINAHSIIKMMSKCQFGGGNLLFNISPNADGSIDSYERETLETVGRWIERHGEAVYGATIRGGSGANGISTSSRKGNRVYLWNWIWGGNFQRINGYKNSPKSVRCITTGEKVDFKYVDGVIHLENLPDESPDKILNFTVFEMDFGNEEPIYELVPRNMVQFMNV